MTRLHLRAGRKRGLENNFAALLCPVLLAISLSGCLDQQKRGEFVSTNMDISSYAQARRRFSANHESTFSFPVLEIYNDSGSLVYRSQESTANAQILKDFPSRLQNLAPQEHASRLSNLVEAVPDFAANRHRILDGKKLVILSVSLDECEACSIQEQALDDGKQRILQQPSVAILEIHVAHP